VPVVEDDAPIRLLLAEVLPELERVAATDGGVAPRRWSVRMEALDAIRNVQAKADAAW
jgi:hypothetical protein